MTRTNLDQTSKTRLDALDGEDCMHFAGLIAEGYKGSRSPVFSSQAGVLTVSHTDRNNQRHVVAGSPGYVLDAINPDRVFITETDTINVAYILGGLLCGGSQPDDQHTAIAPTDEGDEYFSALYAAQQILDGATDVSIVDPTVMQGSSDQTSELRTPAELVGDYVPATSEERINIAFALGVLTARGSSPMQQS